MTVPAGTAHRFWNPGDGEARFLCEVRPTLAFEQLLETMFALAEDGRTNRKGMPNALRLAVIARAHFDVIRLPFPPVALQRLGLVAGAAVGRALGYEVTYVGEAVAQPVVPLGERHLALSIGGRIPHASCGDHRGPTDRRTRSPQDPATGGPSKQHCGQLAHSDHRG